MTEDDKADNQPLFSLENLVKLSIQKLAKMTITRSGNNPDQGTSTDRGTAPDRGSLYLDRRRLIRIKVASGKHLFLWYNSNCDWQRCIGITMTIWAIFITPVTPFQFMGLSLTTWQSGCPFQKEWKPYISSHVFNLMATCDDKQYFPLTVNFVI